MKKRIVAIALALSLALLVCACVDDGGDDNNGDLPSADVNKEVEGMDTEFSDKELGGDYEASEATKITFSQSGAVVDGSGASASGTDVTVNAKGTYILSGSCADGSITVDCGKGNKVQLVLDGLELASADSPAIHIKSGKKITITLASGSTNTLADGESYSALDSDDNADAAIFSKSDLVINGEGSLTVSGNYSHGIVSKDTLTITGGNISVTSKKAGVCGKDSLRITEATLAVNAGSDALRAGSSSDGETESEDATGYVYIKDGSVSLTAYMDGIQATGAVNIEGGSFSIKTTATSSSISAKGIKSDTGIKISGGAFNISSEDDAIHSNGDILISGGDFTISTGDDGVHSDTTLEISGGTIKINKSYEGLEGKEILISGGVMDITSSDDGINAAGGNDKNSGVGGRPGNDFFAGGGSTTGTLVISGGYIIMHIEGDGLDSNGTLEVSGGVILIDGPSKGGNGSVDYETSGTITGGVVVALGTSDMAENFSSATQGSVLVSFNGYGSAGTVISLCDESGSVVLAFTATKSFSCALFSAPEIEKDGTYTVCMNGTVAGLDENGYAHNTTVEGATELGTVTLSGYIYGSGNGMMGGGPGGGPGGHGGGGRPW